MKKTLIILLLVSICSYTVYGQVPTQHTFNSPTTGSYTASSYILLKPGFQSTNFSAIINPDPYIPVVFSDENYVFTRTYQEAMLSPLGITQNKEVLEEITYFDGLGRAKQSIGIKQSPNKNDVVTHIEYDEFGRKTKEYLPYAEASKSGKIFTGDIANATQTYYQQKYADDFAGVSLPEEVNAYSEKQFDNSPLNRVLQQAAPGKDWKLGSGHEIKFDYQTNISGEVKLFGVTTTFADNTYAPTLTGGTSNYVAGELYKMVTKDENWTSGLDHTTEEFKNKQGQVILKRTYNEGQKHDTYYVYDDFGNLTYVLPPKAEAQTDKPTTTELNELCYQYVYDHRNRLVEKKIPGKGREYIIYDKLDRPIWTQDKNQRDKTTKEWLFTKYDAFGRVVYTGKKNHESERTYLQNIITGPTSTYKQHESRGALRTIAGVNIYYTSDAAPTDVHDIYTINYYDDYNVDLPDGLGQTVTTSYGVTSTSKTKGLATVSKVKVLESSPAKWITTVTYYDKKARPIYMYSKNDELGTTDIIESKLDFSGKVLETKTTHTKGSNASIVTIDSFEYDHMGRVTKQTQKINSQETETIVTNEYDELGQLKTKKVGGTLQEVDYAYNVRGWLKNINEDGKNDNDLFNFTLAYNDPTDPLKALYNGNIAQTNWSTLSVNNTSNPVSTQYEYTYDALNRITAAIDNTGEYSVGNITPISYDLNGNILRMQRKRVIDADDNFTYTYNNTNKLQSLSGSKTGSFTYDVNGNMKTDTRKGITNITYNHLNLPTRVDFGSRRIEFTYDASGTKLRKKKIDGSNITTTDYAGGVIYENNVLQYFSHPEGYVKKDGSAFNYVYQYKDHLGNVRLTYADTNNDGVITPSTEIIEEANYFPFGARHRGYNGNVSANGNSLAQKRGFNGKILNDDLLGSNRLDWYDFGARNYDADLGRWMNLDPLAEKYFDNSPYHYAANNPIFFVDPDGKQIDVSDILKKDKKGNYVNKELAEAFLTFAKTDLGKEILGMFAGSGQKIEGTDIEFKEDGIFHQQGIDLSVGTANLNYAYCDDCTSKSDKGVNGVTKTNYGGGKAKIGIWLNTEKNTNNKYAKDYKDNPNDPKARQLYILSRTGSMFHESIIHAVGFSEDYTDDCKRNCSNISSSIRSQTNNVSKREHLQSQKKGSMFHDKAIPAMQKLHKQKKTGIPSNKVKSIMKDYNH
ncbi:DUF6443 domain-containing protein [Tenacibaculum discolor]|uniref:DUF6443 domain-containing protein n=1 Tax=Tenacibaculum discolor TaxID=361581 RepID=UPI003F7A56D7